MLIEEYLERVGNGSHARVDFAEKKFYLNGKEVEVNATPVEDAYSEIEKLYMNYKLSYPSEHSKRSSREYFKALDSEEMSIEELVNGEERTLAKARLEANFLCMVLNGSLTWEDESKWFWQSNVDKELIILKEWIV